MKRLAKDKDCDIQIINGAVTFVQKKLDFIFEAYDVVILSSSLNEKGDVLVIVERRHRK